MTEGMKNSALTHHHELDPVNDLSDFKENAK